MIATSQAERLEQLERWERRTTPLLTVAAILPIAIGLTDTHQGHPVVWLDLASWLVFIVDYVVHLRLKPSYTRSRVGIFDLAIVVLTAPWYLLTGGSGRLLAIGRLARLGRVFVTSKQSRKLRELGSRLGHAALYSVALVLVCAAVVEAAEPASEGFVHYTDAVWWAVVTFTTVGYGDLYPTTSTGRVAAVFLMLGGVALIGSLAASLGSFLQKPQDTEDEFLELQTMQRELLAEVRQLRIEIAELRPREDGSAE
ncbi:MAG: potassium channel family protein [Actinobacteria bacterium]|nr:potassium channel family protein [Actinomycetota bacterium]